MPGQPLHGKYQVLKGHCIMSMMDSRSISFLISLFCAYIIKYKHNIPIFLEILQLILSSFINPNYFLTYNIPSDNGKNKECSQDVRSITHSWSNNKREFRAGDKKVQQSKICPVPFLHHHKISHQSQTLKCPTVL